MNLCILTLCIGVRREVQARVCTHCVRCRLQYRHDEGTITVTISANDARQARSSVFYDQRSVEQLALLDFVHYTSLCIKAMQKLITANKPTSDQKLKSLVQRKGIPLSWAIS